MLHYQSGQRQSDCSLIPSVSCCDFSSNLPQSVRSAISCRVSGLTTSWETYVFDLARFSTADLTRLYVVTEFVFEETPTGICVREIRFVD